MLHLARNNLSLHPADRFVIHVDRYTCSRVQASPAGQPLMVHQHHLSCPCVVLCTHISEFSLKPRGEVDRPVKIETPPFLFDDKKFSRIKNIIETVVDC